MIKKSIASLRCFKKLFVFIVLGCAYLFLFSGPILAANTVRARDLGVPFNGDPGKFNAITDVRGVTVGYKTLISGSGNLVVGQGPIRTGVTAILPRGKEYNPVFAAWYALNGAGDLTGTAWVDQSGFLESPILITNTFSVGITRDTVIEWMYKNKLYDSPYRDVWFAFPVVGETFDGLLNDINGFHVTKQDVFDALEGAQSGYLEEGNVGGGTGMICYGFKGGTGTASRVLSKEDGGYTLGVLVQANYGQRKNLTVAGVPVGQEILDLQPKYSFAPFIGDGKAKNDNSLIGNSNSIIVIVATDAPLLPVQLKRIARRIPMGIARVGGYAQNTSGDLFMVFSTANANVALRSKKDYSEKILLQQIPEKSILMLSNDQMDPLFEATVQATEEAIINALVAAKTMIGINNNTVYGLPHDRLLAILKKYNRLELESK